MSSKKKVVYIITYSTGPTMVVDEQEVQGIDLLIGIGVGDSVKVEKVLMGEDEFEKLQEY